MSALPVEIEGVTRSAFILRGVIAAGSLYGAAAVGPFVSRALAQSSAADVQAVEFALALEEVEAALYESALKNGKLGGEVKKLATEFAGHEATHVSTLKELAGQLGGTAQKLSAHFKIHDQGAFLKTAVAVEDLGVSAYNGMIPKVANPDIVQALASIVQVEARHAAALRIRAGQPPAPNAFEPAVGQAQVQARLRKAGG